MCDIHKKYFRKDFSVRYVCDTFQNFTKIFQLVTCVTYTTKINETFFTKDVLNGYVCNMYQKCFTKVFLVSYICDAHQKIGYVCEISQTLSARDIFQLVVTLIENVLHKIFQLVTCVTFTKNFLRP